MDAETIRKPTLRSVENFANGEDLSFCHGSSNFGHLHCFYFALTLLGTYFVGADRFSASSPLFDVQCEVNV